MQKDVVYIDVEDDITAIIGKVKAAEHKIVALVSPKRIGVIQSAVNLKLVQRAAEDAGKRLVIISSNSALGSLAGSAGIPVAKNLQSKPEVIATDITDTDEDVDVIDGAALPVGGHAAMGKKAAAASVAGAAAVSAIEAEEVAEQAGDATVEDDDTEEEQPAASKKTAALAGLGGTAAAARARGSAVKIPDFNSMRKKMFLIGGGLFALILFLVWALVFAPSARIIVTARTTDAALNTKVTLTNAGATDLKTATIKSDVKTLKKQVSIPFTATGQKNAGDKSTGKVTFSNIGFSSVTISAGSKLTTSGGLVFILDNSVTVPAAGCGSSILNCASGKSTGTVTAAEGGTKYNAATGSLSGANVDANLSGATGGGTDKTVAVVTQEDVDKVSGGVNQSGDADAAKKELNSQFAGSYTVLDTTFKGDAGSVKPTPAVGAEAPDGKGTLTGDVTYSLVAVAKTETGKFLDQYFAQQIDGKPNQKVYSNGLKTVSFTDVSGGDKTNPYAANISTNGKIGPVINEQDLKEFAKGKRYGEIQTHVKQIDGVDDTDVKFAPFWVNAAPNDAKKINVEFKVNGA